MSQLTTIMESPMAKPKRGRPPKSKNEVTTRIDAEVMRKLKILANLQTPKVTIGEYLTQLVSPLVEKKWQQFLGDERQHQK